MVAAMRPVRVLERKMTMNTKKDTKWIAFFMIIFFPSMLATRCFDNWYKKTYTPSMLPAVHAELEYFAPTSTLQNYDRYAGSVTFRSSADKEVTLYIYYVVTNICTKTYKDGSERKQYDCNLRVQDQAKNPTKTYECGGVYSYPVDDPNDITYENYYPQLIREQDTNIAFALYREMYDGSATVVAWDNAYADDA